MYFESFHMHMKLVDTLLQIYPPFFVEFLNFVLSSSPSYPTAPLPLIESTCILTCRLSAKHKTSAPLPAHKKQN